MSSKNDNSDQNITRYITSLGFLSLISLLWLLWLSTEVLQQNQDSPESEQNYLNNVEQALQRVVSVYGLQASDERISGVPLEGIGAGVIIGEDGYVISNYHVVAMVDEIEISDRNGKVYDAKLLALDPQIDLALLSVSAQIGQPAALATNKESKVGEAVYAIGNPFGLSHTVSKGIISALGRRELGIGGYQDFIQTDAAINFGNSGGALFNQFGELIGIISALIVDYQGLRAQGISFAIPVNSVLRVYEKFTSLFASGGLEIGVMTVPDRMLAELQLNADEFQNPIVVVFVDDDSKYIASSRAADNGLLPGDLILQMNGQPPEYLPDALHGLGLFPEWATDLQIIRGNRRMSIRLP